MADTANYASTAVYAERPMVLSSTRARLERVAPYLAEFLGTFFFTFTVLLCLMIGNPEWNATATGLIFVACLYIFGSVNVNGPAVGVHLNPAVSVATWLAGKEPGVKIAGNIFLQITASLAACCLSLLLFPDRLHFPRLVGPTHYFAGTYIPGFIEFFYTAVLCFVVLQTGYSRRNHPSEDQNHFFGLAIGLVLVAGGHTARNISGGIFNPALALAVSPTTTELNWTWRVLSYVGYEFLGALFAAVMHRVCRPEDKLASVEGYASPLPVKMAAELFGTFVLVFTVGVNIVMASPLTAWAATAALTCMVYSLWDVSGAHFNPAVTLAVLLGCRKKCRPNEALAFVVMQFVAGLTAGLIFADIHSKGPFASREFCLKPLNRFDRATGRIATFWLPVLVAEVVFTAVLALTVLAVGTVTPPASHTKQNFPFGFVIGSCLAVGGFAASHISGGALNPAVAVGLQSACPIGNAGEAPTFSYGVCFVLFELAGGVIAATIFMITHRHEYVDREKAVGLRGRDLAD
mmetsp:Transcript_106959/g.300810  ORF Transcript_106959/g.300810 Transcript_106959/m.300810 type:complete len:519 (-) Transcript_106959:144-1700(-)|eukprot:CAMPEP_0117533990 /NCGR_PEP_ID=MMETSP0784-20121206/40180_1 /TAXON_ID=39447 /ORGANISM="" /LENGTH=518 /DNA_ID=CAMNT_0005330455 /DNA_START=31 /DNA_END=1587 /DNA_ORIENTATION=-